MVMEAWAVEARKDWEASYGGTVSDMSIVLALQPLVAAYGWDRIRPCWIAYTQHVEEHQADPRSFAKMVPDVADEKPKAPPRITEAELHYFDQESRYANVTDALRDMMRLVAEVRRLRGIIVSFGSPRSHDRGVSWTSFSDEAQAIRAEEKP